MGRRGRHPDPNSKRSQAALARARQLERPGAAALTRTVQAPAARGMKPPARLSQIPAALAFWKRNAPILEADGRLTPDRVDAFVILCRLHAEIEQLEDVVAAEGWITANDKGQAASPVARLLRDSRRDWVTLARDFGLTAAAAARMPEEPASGETEADEEDQVLAKLSLRGA